MKVRELIAMLQHAPGNAPVSFSDVYGADEDGVFHRGVTGMVYNADGVTLTNEDTD